MAEAEPIKFDAIINKNHMVTIPLATFLKHELAAGDILSVEARVIKKEEIKSLNQHPTPQRP